MHGKNLFCQNPSPVPQLWLTNSFEKQRQSRGCFSVSPYVGLPASQFGSVGISAWLLSAPKNSKDNTCGSTYSWRWCLPWCSFFLPKLTRKVKQGRPRCATGKAGEIANAHRGGSGGNYWVLREHDLGRAYSHLALYWELYVWFQTLR